MPIAYAELIACAIDVNGDTDVFTFSGATGDLADITVSNPSVCVTVQLIGPNQALIQTDVCGHIRHLLTASGAYVIRTSQSGAGTPPISYNVGLQCLGGPCLGAAATAVDHYKCYAARVARGEPRFVQREVALSDDFEAKDTTVVRPVSVCLPVDKNGEGIANSTDHLVCYDIRDVRGQARFAPRAVEVANQFDVAGQPQTLTLTRSDVLCVPSSRHP
jgi:hypothetical protein